MEGLVWFLIFGALLYFMMRHGCGAHMVHGHGGHGGGHGGGHAKHEQTAKSLDPVCGVSVDPDKGYSKMHDGVQYRFCSRDCLDKFEAAPDQYIKASAHDAGGDA